MAETVWFASHLTFPERLIGTPDQNNMAEMGFYSMEWFSEWAVMDRRKTTLVHGPGYLAEAPGLFREARTAQVRHTPSKGEGANTVACRQPHPRILNKTNIAPDTRSYMI